jgi:hypothetical protein
MSRRNWLINGLIATAAVVSLGILGCSGKKGHCSPCKNDADCESGECTNFITSSGDRRLLCGNGQANDPNDSCSVPK